MKDLPRTHKNVPGLSGTEAYRTVSDFSQTAMYHLAVWGRHYIIGLGVFVIAVLAFFVVGPYLTAEPYSDNAFYLTVAKSLSEGSGLRMISNPDRPLALIAPPGYPLLLSGLVKVFGLHSTLPYRLLSVLFWIGVVILTGLLVSREDGRMWGFLVAFLTALNVYVMEYAKEILTELPYMLVAAVVMLLLYRYVDSDGPRRWLGLMPVVIGLSLLLHLRMIGVSLVGAVVLYLWLRREFKVGLVVGGLAGLSYLPWLSLWGSHIPSFGMFTSNTPYAAQTEPVLTVMTERLLSNTSYYMLVVFRNVLGWSYFDNVSNPYLYYLLSFFVVGLVLVGWWVKLTSLKTALTPLYVGLYPLTLLFLVPKGIDRYLIPITPFLIWFFLVGLAVIIGTVGTRLTNNLPRLRLLFFAVCAGLVYSVFISTGLAALDKVSLLTGTTPPEGEAVDSYLQAADWLKNNTPPDAVIMARKMDALYLRSDRHALRYPFTTDQTAMVSFLLEHRISYVILDDLGFPSREQFLLPFLESHQAALEEVFRTPDDMTIVYRVNPEVLEE